LDAADRKETEAYLGSTTLFVARIAHELSKLLIFCAVVFLVYVNLPEAFELRKDHGGIAGGVFLAFFSWRLAKIAAICERVRCATINTSA
jgi:hypothetical protein